MKKLLLILGFLLNTFSQQVFSQADQQLSNLTGTLAINRSLVPGSDYSILDIGNSTNAWKSIYVGSSDADSISSYIMYYTGNIFMHNRGGATTGNSEGLFIGEFAGQNVSNVASVNNGCVGVGFNALQNLGDGYPGSGHAGEGNHNTAIGWRSMYNANGTSGSAADKNTMVGSKSGESLSDGQENTGVGHNVFYKGTNGIAIMGNKNTGIGAGYVFKTLTSGSNNIVIGYGSGTTISTSSNNIIIGYQEEPSLSTDGLNIGGVIYGDLNGKKVSIGNSSSSIASFFNVGTSDQFRINGNGDLIRINNIAYTWPVDDGDSGEQLQTDGSGNLTWQAPGGSVVNVYTGSTSWSKPSGAKSVTVICIGGGGGGGGGSKYAAGGCSGGAGGGAGGFSEATFNADALGTSETVTVGAGGAAGSAASGGSDANGGAGGNGGKSSFGNYLRSSGGAGGGGGTNTGASGGSGGPGLKSNGGAGADANDALAGSNSGNANYSSLGGGSGGGITTGSTATNGGSGGGSITFMNTSPTVGAGGTSGSAGGNGASNPANLGAYLATGGGGGASSTGSTGGAGGYGGSYGAGGGGGGATISTTSGAGGLGAQGVVIVITFL